MNQPKPQPGYTEPAYYNSFNDDSFDFKRYFSLFISNWYWFVIALFFSISIAYGINRWSEEVYMVSSTLLIKDEQLGSVAYGVSNIFPGAEAYKNQQNLKNEIGILKSYKLNYRVIKELPEFSIEYIAVGKRGLVESRLYKKSPFVVEFDSIKKQTIGKKIEIRLLSDSSYKLSIDGDEVFEEVMDFGTRFNERGFDFIINPRNREKVLYEQDASNKYYFMFTAPESQANIYRNKLNVSPVEEEASLVALSISGSVPAQEADYLNKLMDKYIEYGLDVKNQTATKTIDFIEEQLGTISDSLHVAEGDLESFRLNNRLIDISQEGVIIQNRLSQIDREKSAILLQKNYYGYLKGYIDSKSESGDIIAPSVMGISDQLLIKLVDELSLLQKQKKQLSLNLYESSEPLKLVEGNINSTIKAIGENVNNGIEAIEKTLSDANARADEIEKEIRKLPSTERHMINIQRKFDINNTVYTYLLEKRAEASIVKASNVSDNQIIDTAGPFNSYRIKPKERQNYIMAVILGFLFPVLGIFLIDFLNNKIIDKKDIEKGTRAPVLGYISHNSMKTEMPVIEKPGSTLSESFRSVRTNLKYFLKDIPNPVIAVSSTITAEGKTFISVNLAAIIASLGKRVLFIDLDLRKPRTNKILNIDRETGMSKYLINDVQFENIVIKTSIENLWYVSAGPLPPNPAELIDSPEMKEFISKAKEQFDYIIIDTPPVAVVTDALLLSYFTDLYVFVVRQRYSSKNTLNLIEELNRNENIRNIGIIMNDISLSGYYGYGLRYGYSAGYGYSYGYNYYGDYVYSRYGYSEKGEGYYKDNE